MTLDQIARDAATELRETSATLPPREPGTIVTTDRRRRARRAFAAGAVAVAALFLVPIVLSGGPRDGAPDPAAAGGVLAAVARLASTAQTLHVTFGDAARAADTMASLPPEPGRRRRSPSRHRATGRRRPTVTA